MNWKNWFGKKGCCNLSQKISWNGTI